MTASLEQIYQDPAINYDARRWVDLRSIKPEALLDKAGALAQTTDAEDLADELDGLAYDYDKKAAMSTLLGALPLNLVVDNFGPRISTWSIAHDEVPTRARDRVEEITDLGINGPVLWQSILLALQRTSYPTTPEIAAQQSVIEAISADNFDSVDMPKIMQRNVLPGVQISRDRASNYGLVSLSTDYRDYSYGGYVRNLLGKKADESASVTYMLWLDTPDGIALTYRGEPQAILGLVAKGRNEIFIEQLQGVMGYGSKNKPEDDNKALKSSGKLSSRGLAPFDWRAVLVDVGAQIGKHLGLDNIGMVSGKKVATKRYCHISVNEAVRAYDQQAEWQGFAQLSDGDWVKSLGDFED